MTENHKIAMLDQFSKLRGTDTYFPLLLVFILLASVNESAATNNACLERSTADSRVHSTTSELTIQAPIDSQVKLVHDKMSAAGIGQPATVADVQKAYLFYPKLSGTPEHVFRVENRHIPGPAGNLAIRVYTPNSESALPVLVFFHGGGFVAGSLDAYDTPLRAITNRCDCIVVSVAYRLAPKYKYPAAPEDAYAATKWVAEHAGSISGDSRRIAVGGDGAGGNLAAVVTLMAQKRGDPHLSFQVLIYPMLEASTLRPNWFTETDAHTVTKKSKHAVLYTYLPITASLGDPYISPLRADNVSNLPPALVIVYGGDDPTRSEGEDYAHRLIHDGVAARISVYPQAIHGFFLMAGDLDAGKKCIDETARALKNAFAGSSQLAQ
jgi:acetyl esterase